MPHLENPADVQTRVVAPQVCGLYWGRTLTSCAPYGISGGLYGAHTIQWEPWSKQLSAVLVVLHAWPAGSQAQAALGRLQQGLLDLIRLKGCQAHSLKPGVGGEEGKGNKILRLCSGRTHRLLPPGWTPVAQCTAIGGSTPR